MGPDRRLVRLVKSRYPIGMSKFFTVGYESLDIQDFVQGLKKKKVREIIDLRKNPVSRKKGFSKNKLAAHLQEAGIAYRHIPALGVPSEWRKKAKEGEITRQQMFKNYVTQILRREDAELDLLCEKVQEPGITLLCFEKDAQDCHRKFVADEILRREKAARRKTSVTHLEI